jgi:hypothetical protein
MAPDDSPLLLRETDTQEIYALDWEAPVTDKTISHYRILEKLGGGFRQPSSLETEIFP